MADKYVRVTTVKSDVYRIPDPPSGGGGGGGGNSGCGCLIWIVAGLVGLCGTVVYACI